MKKLIVLGVLGLFAIGLMGAAPAINNWAAYKGASITIDSQWTSTEQWELIDSIITVKTDTCYTVYSITGVAVLGPGDRFYFGFDDGGGAGGLPVDTFIVEQFQQSGIKPVRVPFSFQYIDSLISQTDANDTIYWYGAIGGSGASEKVQLEDVVIQVEVNDFNAAGTIGE